MPTRSKRSQPQRQTGSGSICVDCVKQCQTMNEVAHMASRSSLPPTYQHDRVAEQWSNGCSQPNCRSLGQTLPRSAILVGFPGPWKRRTPTHPGPQPVHLTHPLAPTCPLCPLSHLRLWVQMSRSRLHPPSARAAAGSCDSFCKSSSGWKAQPAVSWTLGS
jgi:hypothetical protein